MNIRRLIGLVSCFILCCVVLLQTAQAGEWDHMTKVTTSGPVEVPGVILPAGNYWFVLADDATNRNVVKIFSDDWSKLYAIELTIPVYRDRKTAETTFTFAERPRAGHEALVKWYYPGRETGCEFIYSPEVERRLAHDVQHDVEVPPSS
jgi:hypothetical protein